MTTTNLVPTEIYILSLQSKVSKTCVESRFNVIAKKLQNLTCHKLIDWSCISYITVLTLIQSMSDAGKEPSTVNTYLSALKGGAKSAWMEGVMSVEAYQRIKEVKRVKGQRVDVGIALTTEEIRKLITTCDGSTRSLRDSALLALSYSAGLRREETAKLDISAVDMREGSVTVLGKGNKAAVNYINESAVGIIKKWIKVRGKASGGLFPSIRKGGKINSDSISGQAVSNIVGKRAKAVGFDKVRAHDIRKSFCTNLLEAGEDIFTVSKLMRHSTIATTQIYDKRDSSTSRSASLRLSF